MFLGFSPIHSILVPLVLNVATGCITFQYHVVFGKKIKTRPSGLAPKDEWNCWFFMTWEALFEPPLYADGNINFV